MPLNRGLAETARINRVAVRVIASGIAVGKTPSRGQRLLEKVASSATGRPGPTCRTTVISFAALLQGLPTVEGRTSFPVLAVAFTPKVMASPSRENGFPAFDLGEMQTNRRASGGRSRHLLLGLEGPPA